MNTSEAVAAIQAGYGICLAMDGVNPNLDRRSVSSAAACVGQAMLMVVGCEAAEQLVRGMVGSDDSCRVDPLASIITDRNIGPIIRDGIPCTWASPIRPLATPLTPILRPGKELSVANHGTAASRRPSVTSSHPIGDEIIGGGTGLSSFLSRFSLPASSMEFAFERIGGANTQKVLPTTPPGSGHAPVRPRASDRLFTRGLIAWSKSNKISHNCTELDDEFGP